MPSRVDGSVATLLCRRLRLTHGARMWLSPRRGLTAERAHQIGALTGRQRVPDLLHGDRLLLEVVRQRRILDLGESTPVERGQRLQSGERQPVPKEGTDGGDALIPI